MKTVRRTLSWTSVAVVCLALGACVTEGPPPRPEPRPVPAQPAGLVPNRLLLTVSPYAEDTDRDGVGDLIRASVFLFQENYEFSIASAGSFRFDLVSSEGEAIAAWEYSVEQAAQAQRRVMTGTGYEFRLDLFATSSTPGPTAAGLPRNATLRCLFSPTETGVTPLRPRGASTVVLRQR